MATVARAVHHAHQRGILHRDLKPSNILIDQNDQPRVTDFGLAKRFEEDSELTVSGQVLGSPNYMPPEQARGGKAGRRSDVYGLGAVLYHLLTGRPPFTGQTITETLRELEHADPLAPRLLQPSVPVDLQTIALKCLEKEPRRRYDSAAALAQDLERWLEGKPILARPVSRPERLWLWSRRNPAAVTIVALLLVLTAGAWFAALRLRHQRDETRAHLWRSYLDQARSVRGSIEAGRRLQALEAVREAARLRPTLEVRNEAIASLALDDLVVRKQWAGFPTGTCFMVMDARHQLYARADEQGGVSVRDVESDRQLASFREPDGYCTCLQFSHDGRYLAVRFGASQSRFLIVWDWRGSSMLRLPLPQDYEATAFDFHPDGNSFAVASPTAQQALHHQALPSGDPLGAIRLPAAPVWIRFSPDGRFLAIEFSGQTPTEKWSRRAGIFGTQQWEHVRNFDYGARPRSLGWHPNGRWLAAGCDDYWVYIDDVITGERVRRLGRHELPVVSCAFDSGGERLASMTQDGAVTIWDLAQANVEFRTQVWRGVLSFVPGSMLEAARLGSAKDSWASGVEQLAYGVVPPNILVWRIEPSVVWHPIAGTSGFFSSLEFSPDGRLLVVANPFSGITFCDLDLGKVAAFHSVAGVRSAFFTPGGGHLVTCGHPGLMTWPLRQTNASETTMFRVGPAEAQPVPTTPASETATLADDGRTVAVNFGFAEVWLGDLAGQDTNWWQLPIRGASDFSFSRGGRWLAVASARRDEVRVWDVRLRRTLLQHTAPLMTVRFSPDDRWLVGASNEEYLLWQTASWKLHRRIPAEGVHHAGNPADFSPDRKTLAVVHKARTVLLLDPESGAELATLTPADSSVIQFLRFSPDGTRLAVGTRTRGIHVWDLRALRTELGRLGLDWDRPAFPPALVEPVRPVRIEVLSGM
jgi:WD40 repeat protein